MAISEKYLQNIVFKVEFQEISEAMLLSLQPYFKSVFKLDITDNTLKAIPFDPLRFGDEDKTEQWVLNSDSIMVTLDGSIFKTYEESIIPIANRILRLLEATNITVDHLYINEVFVIPDFKSQTKKEIQDFAQELFSDKLLDNMKGNDFFTTDQTSMYRLTSSSPDKMSFNVVWGSILKDGAQDSQPSRFILDVSAIDRETFDFKSCLIEKTRSIGKEIGKLVKSLLVESTLDKLAENQSI